MLLEELRCPHFVEVLHLRVELAGQLPGAGPTGVRTMEFQGIHGDSCGIIEAGLCFTDFLGPLTLLAGVKVR